MFNISNPTLKRMVLEHLVDQVDSGGLDQLLSAGFSPELIDDLRKRPARDFFHAAQAEGLVIQASIDAQKLKTCLWQRDRVRRDETLKEYFVINGAPYTLVRTLFTLSKQELTKLRKQFDEQAKGVNGRPPFPPLPVRERIHAAWHEICLRSKDEPERERLWRLHQMFPNYSIASLHRCTSEFEEPSAATRQPKAAL